MGTAAVSMRALAGASRAGKQPPNLVFILADQWRAQATGYAGDPNLKGKTPNLDALEKESIDFSNAISTCPVCTPYRASLITGQYPLTHGLFLNDVQLSTKAVSVAQAYTQAGYDTGYIGKWHLDGEGRDRYIPPERRQGFDYWKVLECTHNYNQSRYYAGDDPTMLTWDGYDTISQTKDAQTYITGHANSGKPFTLFLSWGTPHAPYLTAPEKYKELFPEDSIQVRPNVEGEHRKNIAGYYAHIAAIDDCLGVLLKTIDAEGLRDNTIVVVTSDHGDMLGSRGMYKKQRPYDEAIRVPFLLRHPTSHGGGRKVAMPIGTPDILPTLLGLSGIPIPGTVEGKDYSGIVKGGKEPGDNPVLITCPAPFGQWKRSQGGREYRGVRTKRYTYARSLDGPWILYDNETDPYQQDNLIGKPEHAKLQAKLDAALQNILKQNNDKFLPGGDYIKQWGYEVDEGGTVPYAHKSVEKRKPRKKPKKKQ